METKTITAVDIAKDVIKLLDDKKLVAESMTYFSADCEDGAIELQDYLKEPNAQCHVRAVGAALVGMVDLTDNCSINQAHYRSGNRQDRELNEYFSSNQIALMERAFEGWEEMAGYRAKFPYPDDRMRAIFTNIIAGEGVFDPTRDGVELV